MDGKAAPVLRTGDRLIQVTIGGEDQGECREQEILQIFGEKSVNLKKLPKASSQETETAPKFLQTCCEATWTGKTPPRYEAGP